MKIAIPNLGFRFDPQTGKPVKTAPPTTSIEILFQANRAASKTFYNFDSEKTKLLHALREGGYLCLAAVAEELLIQPAYPEDEQPAFKTQLGLLIAACHDAGR